MLSKKDLVLLVDSVLLDSLFHQMIMTAVVVVSVFLPVHPVSFVASDLQVRYLHQIVLLFAFVHVVDSLLQLEKKDFVLYLVIIVLVQIEMKHQVTGSGDDGCCCSSGVNGLRTIFGDDGSN